MREVTIHIANRHAADRIVELVESSCAALGLDRALKGTLKSYPGSIHWHYKKAKARGTLEITWWAAGPRLWIKVAAGRSAGWIEETIPILKERLEAYNGGQT